MTANKNFGKASTVGVFTPYVHLLCKGAKHKRCDYCFVSCNNLKSCTGCAHMKYCSKDCQRCDWKLHKMECPLMKRGRGLQVDDYVLMLYRLHQYSQSEKGSKMNQEVLGKIRTVSDLMSHIEDIKENGKMMENFMKMATELKKYIGTNSIDLINPNQLLVTFGKMIVNSYSILDEDLNNIGIGFYLGPSIIDHSCKPNCVISFDGIYMNVKCLKDVNEGEELYMSYVDLMDCTEIRRAHLKETYFFNCNCEACLDLEMDGRMNEFQNLTSDVDVNSLNEEIKNLKKLLKQIRQEFPTNGAQELIKKHDEATEVLFTKWSTKFTPFNIRLFKFLEHCFESSIELQRWAEVCSYGERITPIYEFYLKDPNPNFGHFLVKLGKVHLYLYQYVEALKCFEKAERIVSITHSQRNALFLSLQSLLIQCRQELNVL